MFLKNIIDQTFKKFTDYNQPDQAVTQMSSLGSLSGDLYQDSKRFIYELLQNADDSAIPGVKSKVVIKLFDNTLVVAHTGKTFDERDVIGISDVGNGTKKNASDKTGYKGIGFKSVFGQSNKVFIYTNGELFRFDETFEHTWLNEWGGTKQEWEDANDRSFKFPWPIIPIYSNPIDINNANIWKFLEDSQYTVATIIELYRPSEISTSLSELAKKTEMYLFLKNIQEIVFDNDIRLQIDIQQNTTGETEMLVNGKSEIVYLKKTILLDVPKYLQDVLQNDKDVPDKIKQAKRTEITLAAKKTSDGFELCKSGEKNLYAYLPTEEKSYDIPILINASFYLAATREHLHKDSAWNQWIMAQIPVALLYWIAELVMTEIGSEAYKLLPKKITNNDGLTTNYNSSLLDAKNDIAFIKNSDGLLLKQDEAIVDMTLLSKGPFVGRKPIIDYKTIVHSKLSFAENPFPEDLANENLRLFGVKSFEWRDFPDMVENTKSFKDIMSLENNIMLIKFLKYQSLYEANRIVNDNLLQNWSFILDHRENISAPKDLYFSQIGIEPEIDSVANFIHPYVEEWLTEDKETKMWLNGLNIKVKSDETFLLNTIIPNATNYATLENTIDTIRRTAGLLDDGTIGLDVPPKLSKLKILTTKGSLIPSENCYFSDRYSPKVKIENLIDEDIFVSIDYILNENSGSIKLLLLKMGVRENFILDESPRMAKSKLVLEGFVEDYFTQHNGLFWSGFFSPHAYQGLSKFNLLGSTDILEFAKLFWTNVISTASVEKIEKEAIAFWGYLEKRGDTDGSKVPNYMQWYIQNSACIPGTNGYCYKSSEILLNSEDIIKIVGNYLPVFDGPMLSDEWRSFFKFKTTLDLSDYLLILTAISSNPDHKKSDQQAIFELILDNLLNYNVVELNAIENWGETGYLSDDNGFYKSTKELYFFVDGNSNDLGEEFKFAYFSQTLQQHLQFETLLNLLGIKIIKQNDFKVQADEITDAKSLTDKLEFIFPYWAQWRRRDAQGGFDQVLTELKEQYHKYTFLQANELKIELGPTWKIKTNQYLNENKFYVVSGWKKMGVLLTLKIDLCKILGVPKLQDQLQFLLLSDKKEIEEYFLFEQIPLPPPELVLEGNFENSTVQKLDILDLELAGKRTIPSEFYHISKADFEKQNFTKTIISRAVTNIINYLKKLPQYDCTNHYEIAESIIGGITKNGNEITVVARPSDNKFMLLYYTSEFDVLEYVDAELWCEDGFTEPKQVTLGQLLKKTGINKIPVKNIDLSNDDLNFFLNTPKNDELDFNPVPYAPYKIAQILSSFANTKGGLIAFGIKEINPDHNEIVGLSNDFQIDEIIKKAISLLTPIPMVEHDWVRINEKPVYIIKTDKAETHILFEDKKYIRNKSFSVIEKEVLTATQSPIKLNVPPFSRTVAIVIAIEKYFPKNQMRDVKYANNDSTIFRNMLIKELNVKEEEIIMFLNENAFKNTIEYELKQLFKSLTENDRLIFYYVGHGFHNGISNYISTYDTHGNNILETSIPLNKILIDPLRKSKCKNALIFIDACATNIVDENERNHWSNINEDELLILSEDFTNYSTFLSCQAGQSSYSSDTLENGIWTYHVVDAISGNVPKVMLNSKYITDTLLRDYLSSSVADHVMNENGKQQNPKAIIDSSYSNIIKEIKI